MLFQGTDASAYYGYVLGRIVEHLFLVEGLLSGSQEFFNPG
jgi:hypothetical protein